MTCIKYFKPFSDWLSLSYSSSSLMNLELDSFLSSLSPVSVEQTGPKKVLYHFGDSLGTCLCTLENNYHNFSFSGSFLRYVRELQREAEFLQLLSTQPHNITRLDVAYDVPVDGPQIITNLQSLYPTGDIRIARRYRKLMYITSPRPSDGKLTGTVYCQTKSYKGTVKLTIYDKSNEVLGKKGLDISPTTRYELRVCRGASLKDYSSPTCVFWHFIPSELLKAPSTFPTWEAKEKIPFELVPSVGLTDHQKLEFLLSNSAFLTDLKTTLSNTDLSYQRSAKMIVNKLLFSGVD